MKGLLLAFSVGRDRIDEALDCARPVPVLKLESDRDRPAHRLTGAQRRAGHGLAARWLLAPVVGIQAMSEA